MAQCTNCGGKGWVTESADRGGVLEITWPTCGPCQGTGNTQEDE
ncbi:hypothetical protein GCM10023222_39720 [Saccharopolyspora cebuensis]